jgi:hypothetical protein
MNLLPLATDNISDLLIKIIEFTHSRRKTILQNIKNIRCPGFVPKDLKTDEFCSLLNDAISEFTLNQRFVLHDTENIKFASSGILIAIPIVDTCAKKLFEENLYEYLELQINKLWENAINQRVAAELFKKRQKTDPNDYWTINCSEEIYTYKNRDNN